MPTTPNRTKKALQELAKVFNKLASELTADLNSAVKEIENLRKEIQRIKSSSGKVNRSPSGSKKSSARVAKSTGTSRTSPARSATHTGTTHGTSKPSHETS